MTSHGEGGDRVDGDLQRILVLVLLLAGAVVSIFRVNYGLALIGAGLFVSKL